MPKINVTKSVVINAPIEKVYAAVRDFKQWSTWSPWLIAEPDCEVKYADDGRSYSWEGEVTGAGNMAIAKEDEPGRIDYDLNFLKPWKSHADVSFSFVEKDGGTEASWSMDSSLPFFMFFLKGMMEGFIGMDYQRGLEMLKDFVETGSVPSKLEFEGSSDFSGISYVGVKTSCRIIDMGSSMEKDMGNLHEWFGQGAAEPAGAPFSIYHKWSPTKGIADYTLGIPVKQFPADLPANFVSGEIPTCKVYRVRHTGPYRHVGNAWASGIMHARAKVFRKSNKIHPFEIYENDPSGTAENDLVTVVHFAEK